MPRARHLLPLASRIAAAVFGGYLFTWGFTTLIVAIAIATGGDYDEGMRLAYLLAFLVFLGAFLWAFAARNLLLVWLVLAGGGAAMTGAAWSLAQSPGIAH